MDFYYPIITIITMAIKLINTMINETKLLIIPDSPKRQVRTFVIAKNQTIIFKSNLLFILKHFWYKK